MDWLLFLLALFNLGSMIAVFLPRAVPRRAVPWVLFGVALLATELSWIWLPMQAGLTLAFVTQGALDSGLGTLALLVLLVTWPGLAWSIRKNLSTGPEVESALKAGLGDDYPSAIPSDRLPTLRRDVQFRDWRNPIGMRLPGVEVLRDIPYAPGGVRQQLDVYRPGNIPDGGCPVILQIHGGAWMVGDKKQQALPLMYALSAKGYICVACNYRLSPSVGFPTHLLDCKSALCWIREHGADYGMNTDFVAVTGGSAGGHLAALMGLTANRPELQPDHPGVDTSVQACIPFYGVYDFMVRHDQHPNKQLYLNFAMHRVMHESPEDNPELWELGSPVAQIHKNAPPFMVVHGDLDSLALVGEARVFTEELRKVSDKPVVYLELPGAEHAFDCFRSPRTEATIDGIQRFLEFARAGSAAQVEQASEAEKPFALCQ
jgi:acetyl esterase/lipase